MLANYDARFSSPEEFAQFAEDSGEPEQVLAALGPPLVMALRRAGRTQEAEAHLQAIEQAHAKLAKGAARWLDTVLLELDIAALRRDHERAAKLVARLPEFGWPYALLRSDPTVLGLLREDPLYDEIRELPAVQEVLAPILRRLAAERAQILTARAASS